MWRTCGGPPFWRAGVARWARRSASWRSWTRAEDDEDHEVSSEVAEARRLLDLLIAEYDEALDLRAEIVAASSRAETIVLWAQEHEVDLIVLATQGHVGFRRLVLGSVADGVLRRSTVPVLAFPPESPDDED